MPKIHNAGFLIHHSLRTRSHQQVYTAPTAQQMNDAIGSVISGTPRNVDGFNTLYITISDPPTQSEVQQLLDSYNNLILALRRNV